jgi:hypothetical protein
MIQMAKGMKIIAGLKDGRKLELIVHISKATSEIKELKEMGATIKSQVTFEQAEYIGTSARILD